METESLTLDAEEQAMRDLGQQTDHEQGREPVEAAETPKPEAPEPEPTPEPQPETEQPPESPEPEPTAAEQLGRDIKTGQFKSRKPETEYSQAVKEEERKDRSWRALQAEKEQFRQYASQWEEQQRMATLEAQRQQYQPVKREGLTAQEYYQGALRFEQEGDHENALKAYKVASEMGREEQGRYQQFQQMNKEYEWRRQMQEVAQVAPQIWDGNNPISQHLARIIDQNPGIYDLPNGFRLAAEAAFYITKMGELKEKDDEIIALKAELEKGRRKGQPAKGGFASPRTSDKEFDEMNLEEMEAHLKGITSEADNWR